MATAGLCFILLCITVLLVEQTSSSAFFDAPADFVQNHGLQQDTYSRVKVKVQKYKAMVARKYNRTIDPEKEDEFFDDLMVTEERIDELVARFTNQHGGGREKRKAINLRNFPRYRWSSFPIKYSFDGTHDSQQRSYIRTALAEWETKTCARFDDVGSDSPSIVFTLGSGCSSYVGNVALNPQPINLARGCLSQPGIPVHEVGHALGLYHEHQRPDRDDHVRVLFDNVQPGKESNFDKLSERNIASLDVPYDYSSVMHYSSSSFQVSSANTIETRSPKYQTSIGQRYGLSFRDAKIVNLLYCKDICSSSPPLACPGESYQDPNDCTRCVCPDGLAGTLCDTLADSSPICNTGTIPLQATSDEQCLFSPNYDDGKVVPQGTECYWQIEAPPGGRIQYSFSQLSMSCSGRTGNRYCSLDWLAIKDSTDVYAQRFCCDEPLATTYESTTNRLMVNLNKNAGTSRTEFKLCYRTTETCSEKCDSNASCVEVDGDYICQCNEGFSGDGKTCTATSPCGDSCDPNASCTEISGIFFCRCNEGYTGNGNTCSPDVSDQCDDTCDTNAACVLAELGEYSCRCLAGYTGDGVTCEVISCSTTCDPNASCVEIGDNFYCLCNRGYMGDGRICIAETCIDVCDANATCVKTGGTFDCRCNEGYTGDGQICAGNENVCTEQCHPNSSCVDIGITMSCLCDRGFIGDGITCIANTCAVTCDLYATCVEAGGEFECRCNNGYSGNGVTCTADTCTDQCDDNAACVVDVGRYQCRCNQGYVGDGSTCSAQTCTENCDPNASCVEVEGGYECQCDEGFTGDGTTCTAAPGCQCAIRPNKKLRLPCTYTPRDGVEDPEACTRAGCCWEVSRKAPDCYKPREDVTSRELADCSAADDSSFKRRKLGWRLITEEQCQCLGGCYDNNDSKKPCSKPPSR